MGNFLDFLAEIQQRVPDPDGVLAKVLTSEKASPTPNGGSSPFVGETNPATFLASGTEYVWMKLDGAGNLIDIITGKVA